MRQHPCPICGRLFDPNSSSAMPFCSPRCRQIDLARWLGERYRVSGPVQEEAEESLAEPSSPTDTDAAQDDNAPEEESSPQQG